MFTGKTLLSVYGVFREKSWIGREAEHMGAGEEFLCIHINVAAVRTKSQKLYEKGEVNPMNNLKEKKLNNKGFSLVELIIVIAIMAVLVGVLAPQYMRYVERSRVSADTEVASGLQGAITTALLDPALEGATDKPSMPTAKAAIPTTAPAGDFWKDVMATMGVTDGAELNKELKSKGAAATGLSYAVDDLGKVTVYFTHDSTEVEVD